jgi:hypothetical protein
MPIALSTPSATALYGPRAVDQQRATVDQPHLAAEVEFVALGVAAEVVVVVEQQDARLRIGIAIEESGRQAADPAPTTTRS